MSFARKFGDKYGTKLMDTAKKKTHTQRNKRCKNCFQTSSLKTAEATGDLIGNKMAGKITLLGKTNSKEKEDERQEIYIPPEKNSKLLMT